MRFKSFLLESNSSRKSVDIDTALDFLKNSCDDYLRACSAAGRLLIFRGERSSRPFEIADSSKFIRGSANTESWYNMWIDNSDKWKRHQFPKRLSSFICSSIFSDDYGASKLIFPTNSCRIGVCPQADIWISFNLDDVFKCSSIDAFQSVVFKTWKLVSGPMSGTVLPDIKTALRSNSDKKDLDYLKTLSRTYYAELKRQLTACTLEKIIEKVEELYSSESGTAEIGHINDATIKELGAFLKTKQASLLITGSSTVYFTENLADLISTMHRLRLKNLAQVFDYVLDPDKTAFKSLSPAEMAIINGEKEIWVGGECLIVEPDLIKSDEDQVKFIKFFGDYGINTAKYLED